MIRVVWDLEEMVAMADICLRRKEMSKEQIEHELKRLSEALNYRADCLGIRHDDKFRNYNGMKYTYQNMLYVITDGNEGMSNGNKRLYDVYMMWKDHRSLFESILGQFNQKYRNDLLPS